MTTTTADRHGMRSRGRSRPCLLPVAAAILLLPGMARAQWDIIPSIGVIETYTDNVNLRNDDDKQSQFITELRPRLSVVSNSRRLKVQATGEFGKYIYSDKDDIDNPTGSVRRYAADLQGTLAEQLLYIDARASSSRQNIVAFGPGAVENPFTNANQTNVKTWSISPYLVRRFGRDTTAQLRWSRDSVETDLRNPFGTSLGSTVSVNLANGADRRAFSWGVNHLRQDIDNKLVGESSTQTSSVFARYQFSRTWAGTATAGYDHYDFEGPGSDNSGKNWSVGFAWTPSLRTSVQATAGRHLYGKTGSLAAVHRGRRTVWDIQYTDRITSSRSQYLLPAAIDTASMLDRLFSTTILDPVERQRLVAAYIQSTGLPLSLADDVNFLSNRYAREKDLRASVAYRTARGTAVLNAFRTERTALSDQASDSPLLGNQFSALNDNVRQRGGGVSYSYRLSERADIVTGVDYRFSQSLTTNIEDRQRTLRVVVNHRMGRNLLASLEARRRSGATDYIIARDYTERALVGRLSMQF